jgi:uncharacterized membrane protein
MRATVSWSRFNGLAAIGLAVGLIGLGVLSILYRDFTLQWEPVPPGVPMRHLLGAASGALLLTCGVLLTMKGRRAAGAALTATFIGVWVVFLHLPKALAHPTNLAGWLAIAETLAMSTGALVLFREQRGGAAKDIWARIALLLFGLSLVAFGISHFLFAEFTASMVPAWLPQRLALAYLTGAIHALAGVAVLLGVQRRAALVVEATMMSSFVALVHVPRVLAHPADRTELTLLFVAITLASTTWAVATSRALR